MITKETLDNMADDEFDIYLEERRKTKPYLDRYVKENGYASGVSFEDWLKVELRDAKLKQLGI